ncbi:MAG: 3-isopropylmalate dehydratase large subunit [Synergistaceae bacterium]|jgi:3-isopropylmalate dehydratase large subunit|nr:3-isopropylmalate dehydratase large subunit [Synergistaceae bacterium]
MCPTRAVNILSSKCGERDARPGDIVDAPVDRAMIHDNNAALVIENFGRIAGASVWSPDRTVFFIDHHSPSTSVKAVKHHSLMRRFARDNGITRLFDCGWGISHVVMIEEGLAAPGEIVAGTDSHTTGEGASGAFATGIGATEMAAVLAAGRVWLKVPETVKISLNGALPPGVYARDVMTAVLGRLGPEGANYRSVEFQGSAADAMSLDDRIVCCVMSMEMGAKNAVFVSAPDEDAEYERVEEFDVSSMTPMAALPGLPTNAVPLSEIADGGVKIDQAFIGSCSGGLLGDIETAARILEGKRVADGVRLIVIPATRRIYNESLKRGYIGILHDAGAVIGSPACGGCGGHDAGILAEGEVCVANSPRNMEGRMGAGGVVYLANSAAVAISALTGHITGEERRDAR